MKIKLENWKIQHLGAKSQTDDKTDDMDTEEQPLMRSGTENFIDELSEECVISPPDDAVTYQTVASFFHSQLNSDNNTLLHKDFSAQQQAVKGYEWIEMGVRRQEIGIFTEETEKIVESAATKERGVAWIHSVQSTPVLDHFNHITAPDPRNNTSGPHHLLLDGYPDVDYPVDEDGSSQPSHPTDQPTVLRVPVEGGISTKMDSDSQSMNQDTGKNISCSPSVNMETSPEAWSFSKILKSPRLRKRRTVISHQGPSTQTPRPFTQDSKKAWSVSFSDFNQNTDRNSGSSEQTSDSRRSLTLGSLKPNQELYWNVREQGHLDPQIFSEPELADLNHCDKWAKIKTQRSASIPNVNNEGGHQLHLHSRSLYALPLERNSQFPISQLNTNGHHSPLEGLLERAKERVRDRDEFKRDRNIMSRYPPSSPSFSTTPSPSLSDGDRDTEWEEVALMRHRALTVSKGWKEQLVDGDEDEKRGRSVCQGFLDLHMLFIS